MSELVAYPTNRASSGVKFQNQLWGMRSLKIAQPISYKREGAVTEYLNEDVKTLLMRITASKRLPLAI